jgi:hypothetical protein
MSKSCSCGVMRQHANESESTSEGGKITPFSREITSNDGHMMQFSICKSILIVVLVLTVDFWVALAPVEHRARYMQSDHDDGM